MCRDQIVSTGQIDWGTISAVHAYDNMKCPRMHYQLSVDLDTRGPLHGHTADWLGLPACVESKLTVQVRLIEERFQLCMHMTTRFAHACIINWALILIPEVHCMAILPISLVCLHVSWPNWQYRSDWLRNDDINTNLYEYICTEMLISNSLAHRKINF
jgi:hypothetical protein